MRKFLALFAVLILSGVLAFAQEKTISGKVTDQNGNPVPFATVVIESTNTGVASDANGKFILKANPGNKLTVSATGMKTTEVTVGAGNFLDVQMQTDQVSLQEVVVTGAFGIKKDERTTSNSYQVISQEQLDVIPHSNINDALAGKVAGVQFRGQSPMKLNTTGEGFMRIRGGQSLSDVGPIFVVDGTVVNSFDINPDDIASVTVLKGANATALFGGTASNGAIVMTTKKGVQKGVGIQVNQSVTFDKVYILPQYQNLYSGGASANLITFHWQDGMPEGWKALDGKGYPDYTDDASWGPKMEGQEYIPWYAWFPGTKYSFKTAKLTPQPDNVRDFYNTGVTTNSNIAFSKGGDNYNFRLSYSNQSIKGMLPNSNSSKNNFFTSVSYDLNPHFNAGANLTFNTQNINGEFNDDYSNFSSGSFNQWFHRDLDMGIEREFKNFLSPIGTLASWNFTSNPNSYDPADPGSFWPGNFWYNPFSYFDNVDYSRYRNRLFGDIHLTYKLNNNFNIRATVRKNQLTTRNSYITKSIVEHSANQTGVLASYQPEETDYQEYNYELLANYQQKFGDFDVSVLGGANKNTTNYMSMIMATQQGLNIDDLYAITNSKAQPSLTNVRERSETNSLFASGDFGYNKIVNLNLTVRNDWYSTLPADHNSLLSPSAGVSFIFSELTGPGISWLSFGKVFGSWGKKPLALGIYQNNLAYNLNQFSWNGNFLIETPNSLPDPNLKGSLITTYEAGLDLRFINNRYGLKATFYHELNDKAPISVTIDGISGFTSKVVNAASIERTGLEFEVNANPIASRNFSWNINATFSYLLHNKVLNLFGDQQRIPMSGQVTFASAYFALQAYQEKGKDWGQLIGGGAKRDSATGLYLYKITKDANGNPTRGTNILDPEKHWGSIVPKVNGGIINSLTYKDFVFNFSVDYQVGGKYFSLDENWGEYSGLLATTAATNDRGKNVRDAVADGGGVHIKGIDAADGKPVDFYMDAQRYFHSFLQASAERYIHDLTYVKLREISLGYQLPVKKWGANWLNGAVVSVVARNPWLIYNKNKNFDPSEVSVTAGSNAQYPGTRSLGFELKLNF
ncbi:MAG TPA: SusC/RagA family TonB-linked outer membrane protein [Hanamia sp.]|nr:SusC/RagA family TonB-linked outer membrane protein [Hanamia sp.]